MFVKSFWLIIKLILVASRCYGWLTDEQRLLTGLMQNYEKESRPVFNASHSVEVKFSFSLIQICDLDERNQVLTTYVWLEQEWVDENLKWNSSDYSGLETINMPCNNLWLPDIVLYNSASDFTDGYMESKAKVTPEGKVFWPPPAKLRSSCKIDVTFFPFDDQICTLKFGSWTYSGLQLNLLNNTVDLLNYVESGEWQLRSIKVVRNVVYYPCCPKEPYPDLTFHIIMRRRILYFVLNIIIPCVWLSILNLVTFLMPPDSGEKVSLGITVLLAFSVFMLLVAENIPATSETVPLIVIYLTTNMSLTSLSIILTVIVLQIHQSTIFDPEIPTWLYKFMTRKVAKYAGMLPLVKRLEDDDAKHRNDLRNIKCPECMTDLTKICNCPKMRDESSIYEEVRFEKLSAIPNFNTLFERNSKHQKKIQKWKLVALILDRCLFLTFTFVTLVTSSILIIVLPVLKHQDVI